MDDPRIARQMQTMPEGPALKQSVPSGVRVPLIGEIVHFFPHRGHHTESHFAPHAAIVISVHPTEPRLANLYFFGPKGDVGSYEHIPHRSLTPGVEPIDAWLGKCMPPQSHWEFIIP